MTVEVGRTIRERVLAASTSFDVIEAVVLTTFGFNADFLEEHALAAVLGMDGDATPARRQAVHEALADTPLTVAYDATTGSAPSGLYRYLALPVPVVGRLFHPKVILIAGRASDGGRQIWAGVGSANLTLSGWGRNAESFGSVWLRSQDQQPVTALSDFVSQLARWTGIDAVDTTEALSVVAAALDSLVAEQPTDPTDDSRIYISSVHTAGFPAFVSDTAAGSQLLAMSPYWSDVERSIRSFGADTTQLVPALRQDGRGVGLLREQAVSPSDGVELSRNTTDDGSRFWHAKLYRFLAPDGAATTAVGSCNFSSPGLIGGQGNIEVMLVTEQAGVGLPTGADLASLSVDDLPQLPPEDDAAPTPLPVGAVVIWDWSEHRYRWLLEDGGTGRQYTLSLPALSPIDVPAGSGATTATPPSRGDRFTLSWQPEGHQAGAIVEVNLHLSPRTYGRRLKASEILDSWRGRPVYVGGDGDVGAGDELWDVGEGHGSGDGAELPFDAFDLFDFHRSLRRLEATVRGSHDRPSVQRGLLVTRPDSVWSLAQLTARAEAPAALRFLVLTELAQTARSFPTALDEQTLSRLEELEAGARAATLTELSADIADASLAAEMLTWFESKAAALGGDL